MVEVGKASELPAVKGTEVLAVADEPSRHPASEILANGPTEPVELLQPLAHTALRGCQGGIVPAEQRRRMRSPRFRDGLVPGQAPIARRPIRADRSGCRYTLPTGGRNRNSRVRR